MHFESVHYLMTKRDIGYASRVVMYQPQIASTTFKTRSNSLRRWFFIYILSGISMPRSQRPFFIV